MAPRRCPQKRSKGAGLNRMTALYEGTKIKTFCCENKTTGDMQFGTTTENKGSNCDPNPTGQCLPTSYKFRCFDTKNQGLDGSVGHRDTIAEGGDEKCQYVASMAGKVGSTIGNTANLGSNFFSGNWKLYPTGGKQKSKRRRSNKKRRTNKRK